MTDKINPHAPELKAVRELLETRVRDKTALVVSIRTPLDQVPVHRGDIAACVWLLDELKVKEPQ